MEKGKDIIYSAKRIWKIYVSAFFRRNWMRITNIGYRSRKIWHFIKVGWKDQDWDYAYMLYMEKAKLEDMAKYYATSHIAVNDWAVARDAKICSRLIDIINGDDASFTYNEKWQKIKLKRVNTKNWKRFIRCGRFSEWLENEDYRYIIEDDIRIGKAWNLYCKIRQYNMRSWWN